MHVQLQYLHVAFRKSSHIPAIPRDVPRIFPTPQSKHNISERFGILLSYAPFFTFHHRLDLCGSSHAYPLWPLPKHRKQRIGSSLIFTLQLIQLILILCCFRSAFARLVQVDRPISAPGCSLWLDKSIYPDLFRPLLFIPIPELPRWLWRHPGLEFPKWPPMEDP